jgi:plasmid stabilization system protein ParE
MRIRWTEPAARDLTNICDYTEKHDGPEAARRVALRIYEGLGTLARSRVVGARAASPVRASLYFPAFPF